MAALVAACLLAVGVVVAATMPLPRWAVIEQSARADAETHQGEAGGGGGGGSKSGHAGETASASGAASPNSSAAPVSSTASRDGGDVVDLAGSAKVNVPTFGFTLPEAEPLPTPHEEAHARPQPAEPAASAPSGATSTTTPPSAGDTPVTEGSGDGAGQGSGSGDGAGTGTGSGTGGGSGNGNGNGSGNGNDPAPQFMGLTANGRNIVYVIDRSTSMTGPRFDDTLRQLRASINALPSSATFCVIFFSSPLPGRGESDGYLVMPPRRMVRATKTHKEDAIEWINAVTPAGGTDPTRALAQALALRPDTIYLMTDGQFQSPADVEAVLASQNKNRRTAIYTIAFHDRSQESLLQRIAATYRGEYRFIPPGMSP